MQIFKFDNIEGSLGSGDIKFIYCNFKPCIEKEYNIRVPIIFSDDINKDIVEYITVKGIGYQPKANIIHQNFNQHEQLPISRIHNQMEGKIIQKCGLSIEVKYFV
jgi:hypothetical protein